MSAQDFKVTHAFKGDTVGHDVKITAPKCALGKLEGTVNDKGVPGLTITRKFRAALAGRRARNCCQSVVTQTRFLRPARRRQGPGRSEDQHWRQSEQPGVPLRHARGGNAANAGHTDATMEEPESIHQHDHLKSRRASTGPTNLPPVLRHRDLCAYPQSRLAELALP